MTPEFDKNWMKMGLDDDDLRMLQEVILLYPDTGQVIEGTGGLRKIRFSLDKGKSRGARLLYVDLVACHQIYLITAYPKSFKKDLTHDEKKHIKKMISVLKASVRERRM